MMTFLVVGYDGMTGIETKEVKFENPAQIQVDCVFTRDIAEWARNSLVGQYRNDDVGNKWKEPTYCIVRIA